LVFLDICSESIPGQAVVRPEMFLTLRGSVDCPALSPSFSENQEIYPGFQAGLELDS